MDSDLWARLAVTCQGINVLLAPDNPAAPVEIDSEAAGELVSFWRSHYDAIVLDTPGAQPAAVEFARLADEVLVVTTNELAALHAARRTIECLEQNGVERRRLRLVVNRYTPATGLKREEVETALKMEPFALLANEYDMLQQAVLDGRPAAATTRFGRSVHALAQKLEGKEPPPKKRAGLLALLPQR
jgi:pilus assembly protein CpaE